jgi:D-serine deaminase-like pyridoxal phosphate-dependent protein
MDLTSRPTPSLVLDLARVRSNAERIGSRVREMGARLRPHVKTHKCVEVARLQTAGFGAGVTVSTLAEGLAFAEAGFTDLTYAVPIDPGKFGRAADLARRAERLALVTDDPEVPAALDDAASREGVTFDVFVKIDCGYHRCGVEPDDPRAVDIPRRLADARHLRFAGILTHAGHSYHARSWDEVREIARHERDVMVEHAARLRREGIPVPTVSVGSTPTMAAVDHLDGVDEARPGNYIFFDEFQAALGSCAPEDCALSVVAAVVHRDAARRRVVVDAGAIALSKDTGAGRGFGRVVTLEGEDTGCRVASLSQEHGQVDVPDDATFARLKVGTRVRIVANHSCLTAAQYPFYNVVEDNRVVDRWTIHRGW